LEGGGKKLSHSKLRDISVFLTCTPPLIYTN
jgi:hypothetical protein